MGAATLVMREPSTAVCREFKGAAMSASAGAAGLGLLLLGMQLGGSGRSDDADLGSITNGTNAGRRPRVWFECLPSCPGDAYSGSRGCMLG